MVAQPSVDIVQRGCWCAETIGQRLGDTLSKLDELLSGANIAFDIRHIEMDRAFRRIGAVANIVDMDNASNKRIPPNKPATLADVALQAGVSAMTVSRVVNGDSAVKPSTRKRVMAAVEQLKYMSSQAVRRMAEVDPIRIGVLYNNPSTGYLSELLIGLINEASASGIQLLVEWVDQPHGADRADAFLSSGLDAVIIPPPLSDQGPLVDSLLAKGLAVMLVGPGKADPRASLMEVDHRAAAMRMTEHLIALGHQRIGFIAGSSVHSASECRRAGFLEAMHKACLTTPDELMAAGLFTYNSGLLAAEALLAQVPRPTAIFASNDDMAAATIAMAHQLGIDVPGDLTVVGCDDTPIATSSRPELTTIRQPIRVMAANAVSILANQVRARRAGTGFAPSVVKMQCELVRRQSDAAPRKRTRLPVSPRLRT